MFVKSILRSFITKFESAQYQMAESLNVLEFKVTASHFVLLLSSTSLDILISYNLPTILALMLICRIIEKIMRWWQTVSWSVVYKRYFPCLGLRWNEFVFLNRLMIRKTNVREFPDKFGYHHPNSRSSSILFE